MFQNIPLHGSRLRKAGCPQPVHPKSSVPAASSSSKFDIALLLSDANCSSLSRASIVNGAGGVLSMFGMDIPGIMKSGGALNLDSIRLALRHKSRMAASRQIRVRFA